MPPDPPQFADRDGAPRDAIDMVTHGARHGQPGTVIATQLVAHADHDHPVVVLVSHDQP